MKYLKYIIILFIVLLGGFLFFFLKGNKKEEKEPKVVDETVPTITVIKEKILIDGDTEFDPLSNIQVKYGITGGDTVCDKTELEVGKNIIHCTATGSNKLTSTASYTVVMSKTYKKNAIFFGDSIVYGFISSPRGYSWANYIGDKYDLNKSTNAGISDYRVSTYDAPHKWLGTQVRNHYKDKYNYDFVILQGGVNDVLVNTPMGSISNNKDIKSFNPRTFCGGLESYLYYATTKWKNARIGYIITYNTPNYVERGFKWSYSDYKKYYDKTKEILDKWNIKYLDFSSEEFNQKLKVETRTYLPDYLHLNNAGYKLVTPYIYKFMQTLDKYN